MLEIRPPEYSFCPFCGEKLHTKQEEGKDFKFCPFDKWTYYPHVAAASAAIVLKENKILLVKRNREPYKGKWMFPAGFVDFGEHPKETATREALEETGNIVINPRFIDVLQVGDDPRQPGHLVFFYRVDIQSEGEKIADHEENEEIGYFNIHDLPEIGWESHKQIARRLQEGQI